MSVVLLSSQVNQCKDLTLGAPKPEFHGYSRLPSQKVRFRIEKNPPRAGGHLGRPLVNDPLSYFNDRPHSDCR